MLKLWLSLSQCATNDFIVANTIILDGDIAGASLPNADDQGYVDVISKTSDVSSLFVNSAYVNRAR